MMKTVLGVFSDKNDVEVAVDRLKEIGFDASDISILMKDTRENISKGTATAEGALGGAATGALLGGLAGLLASSVLPGIGAIFVGGPLAAALGLTGVAASAASGAATGALAGTVIGALTGFGLSESQAKEYVDQIEAGAILLAVSAFESQEDSVISVLENSGASDIIAVEPKATEYGFRQESREYGSGFAYAGTKGGKARIHRGSKPKSPKWRKA